MSINAADDFDFIKKRLKELQEEQKESKEDSIIPDQIYYDGLTPLPGPVDVGVITKQLIDRYKQIYFHSRPSSNINHTPDSATNSNVVKSDSGIPSDTNPIVYYDIRKPSKSNFNFDKFFISTINSKEYKDYLKYVNEMAIGLYSE